jgi:hypothetical protein
MLDHFVKWKKRKQCKLTEILRAKEIHKNRLKRLTKKKGTIKLERFFKKRKRKKGSFVTEHTKLTVFRISKFPETDPTKRKEKLVIVS